MGVQGRQQGGAKDLFPAVAAALNLELQKLMWPVMPKRGKAFLTVFLARGPA